MALDMALSTVQQAVPECVAVGFVDMTTGMLLGVRTIDSPPQEVLDLVAAATADLFQGHSVVSIERLFRKSRGQPEESKHYFNEIVVFSDNLLHVFLRSRRVHDHVLVFVCRATANIGMVLSRARASVAHVEAS